MRHLLCCVLFKTKYTLTCLCAVCEEVCDEPNLFDDNQALVGHVSGMPDAKDFVRVPENMLLLEERIKLWIKRVQEVNNSFLHEHIFSVSGRALHLTC